MNNGGHVFHERPVTKYPYLPMMQDIIDQIDNVKFMTKICRRDYSERRY